tara:strand:- start:120 stop:278 length:159 start_codon:yes stop_codon:yes gene_type:complete
VQTIATIWLWIVPVLADQDPQLAEAAKHPLLLKALSVGIIAWGFRDRLPWIS